MCISGTARRGNAGAGKPETKVRVIRASAQQGITASKTSFPCQDPLRSCKNASSQPRTAPLHAHILACMVQTANGCASCICGRVKAGEWQGAASVSFVILITMRNGAPALLPLLRTSRLVTEQALLLTRHLFPLSSIPLAPHKNLPQLLCWKLFG